MSSNPELIAGLLYFAGVVLRVFLPYLQAYLEDPSLEWDWRYLAGLLVGGLTGVALPALVAPGFLSELAVSTYIAIIGYGWFATAIGRLGDKTLTGHGE